MEKTIQPRPLLGGRGALGGKITGGGVEKAGGCGVTGGIASSIMAKITAIVRKEQE
jgi:hypothetical protein